MEYAILVWNVAGLVILAVTAVAARSVALAGFGLDSLIEIGASIVVIWELSGTNQDRQHRALRLIGVAFALLAVYVTISVDRCVGRGLSPTTQPGGYRLDRADRCCDVRARDR